MVALEQNAALFFTSNTEGPVVRNWARNGWHVESQKFNSLAVLHVSRVRLHLVLSWTHCFL